MFELDPWVPLVVLRSVSTVDAKFPFRDRSDDWFVAAYLITRPKAAYSDCGRTAVLLRLFFGESCIDFRRHE